MFKKIATYMCMFLVGGMGFLGVSLKTDRQDYIQGISIEFGIVTYAADPCAGPNPPIPCLSAGNNSDAETQKMLQSLVNGLNIILDVLTIIVTPAMILASWLMSPDWTSGDLFQIRPMIHDLWIVVSNVTYFIYAILLIFIALATIFNSDKYGYKQLLPKLALGILMVPLSWWFIQFTISLASVVTASVINMPTEVVIEYSKKNATSWWTAPSIPKETKFDTEKKNTEKRPCALLAGPSVPNQQECISPEKFVENAGGMYSNLMLYSFAVFRFQDIKALNSSGTNPIKSISQIIHQGLIGAIMFIVYGLLVLSLVFMLMIRAIKLWFYAIFSPLMTLRYVIGDGMFKEDKSGSFEIKEFIGLAFVPAIVGLALSFGLIIVSVMMSPLKPDSACTPQECTITLFGIPSNNIVSKIVPSGTSGQQQTITTVTIGGASYIFSGDVGPGSATSTISTGLNTTGGIIGTIIVDIIALIFIWLAFMAAKSVSKVATIAFSPFEKFGKQMAGMVKYAPIPFTGGMSANSMGKVGGIMESNAINRDNKSFEGSKLGKILGAEKNMPPDVDDRLKTATSDLDLNKSGTIDKFKEQWKNAQVNLQRENSYNAEAFDALMAKIKSVDVSQKNKILDSLGVKDTEQRSKLIAYSERDFKSLPTEDKKKIRDAIVGGVSGTAKANDSSNLYNISITPDGKLNVGTVRVDTTLDSGIDKIAAAIKASSLNKSVTESDLKEAFKKTTQFGGNEQKLQELISKLGTDFFKEQKKEEPKKS